MYSPMMSQSVLSRGMLPYIPRAQPSPASRRKKAAAAAAAASSSEADGESLTKSTSKSSQTSSGGGGEPSSSPRASLDAPLESDRPADAAAGVEPEHQHPRKHKRRSSRKQHDQDANHNNNNNNTTTSTTSTAGSTGTTPGGQTQPARGASADATPPPHPQHHSRHHSQQKPGPSASSSSSPPLPSAAAAASPKPAPPPQHGAFKRASHSIIARAKHHDHHPLSLQTGPKHAHAHHNSSSTPRSPAAAVAHMNGNTVADIFAHAARNMSSSATTDASASASSRENLLTSKPFVLRNGRAYLNDTSLPYPLPADLTELHRQSMRTLLLIQVFGGPVCSPAFSKRPPQRVLEIGCGSGFWSMMCHRYFKSRGHGNISFTGIDIAPLAPTEPTTSTSNTTAASAVKPDPEMNWTFMSHDLRQLPWPMEDEHFDLVMVKDMSLATTNLQHQPFIDEYIRLLRPGGVLEIWESDHLIRMLRPHVPDTKLSGDDTEDQEAATSLGAYIMNANTPLSAPLNTFLVEYNQWLSRALEARDLTAVPCTLIGPTLLQESETLADVRSRRLAIPLSEVRWEREGVGGVVTKDGKPTAASSSKDRAPPKVESRVLSPGQEALRQTALLTVVQQVQALEPILREVSGKSQDEWDVWLGKMMGDLMSDGGTSWGECLEVGAWSATKRKR